MSKTSEDESVKVRWEQRFGRSLTDEEYRALKQNVRGYFEVLAKINRRIKSAEEPSPQVGMPSNNEVQK
jgi:hypothetical protein